MNRRQRILFYAVTALDSGAVSTAEEAIAVGEEAEQFMNPERTDRE